MSPLLQGIVSGLIFGALTVVAMLRMKFPDKPVAFTAAFMNRFSIGLLIPLLRGSVVMPGWALGAGVGALLSLPSALITKAYAPIMILGVIGGAVIGALA
jgi:hypothetical protein